MMRRNDPRLRKAIDQISHNFESANESAQEGIYSFSHNYLGPCFSSIRDCVGSCTGSCFPSRQDQLRRRRRGRSSGRAELNFDFYDDWDYEEDATGDALLGWGNDELDRLLAGSSGSRSSNDQPRNHRRMSYGARGGRRKSAAMSNDERQDPTLIPSSSFLGFLERFPWRIGAKGIRYRPSAAGLQENPGGARRNTAESEPLIEGSDESDEDEATKRRSEEAAAQGRQRSETQSSRETTTSLSSRGDLLPSDEEEDAVPLDDEFAMMLERRATSVGSEEPSSQRRSMSGTSTRATTSSKDSRSTGKGKGKRKRKSRKSTMTAKSPRSSSSPSGIEGIDRIERVDVPTIADLNKEEEQARLEEEKEIEHRRFAAQKLALDRGLTFNEETENVSNIVHAHLPLLYQLSSVRANCSIPA